MSVDIETVCMGVFYRLFCISTAISFCSWIFRMNSPPIKAKTQLRTIFIYSVCNLKEVVLLPVSFSQSRSRETKQFLVT